MSHAPSPQQLAIYQAITSTTDSLRIIAVAGSGKTTTLVGGTSRMSGNIAMAAYNKAIANEIAGKVTNPRVKVGTFHSFGMSALMRNASKKITVNSQKVRHFLIKSHIAEPLVPFMSSLISLTKQRALSAPTEAELRAIIDHFSLAEMLPLFNANELLEEALYQTPRAMDAMRGDLSTIDFDDMIYLPIVMDLQVPQYDWVLVDEAQDTNPARRLFARKMLRSSGRMVAVGDPHQAIYGFTGADSDALDLIAEEFGCVDYPLTVTYRCPKLVVAMAQQYVSHIQAAPSAPDGVTRTIVESDLLKEQFRPNDAIICRLTKPLVQTAFALIRKGIACRVEGRDIGTGLSRLLYRFNDRKTIQDVIAAMTEYHDMETTRLRARDEEGKIAELTDRVDTLLVIAEQFPPTASPAMMMQEIGRLFGDTPEGTEQQMVTLCTVHKSKGREWDRVYLLGREKFMPSRWARTDWQREQEVNLVYVALTRTKHELIDVQYA